MKFFFATILLLGAAGALAQEGWTPSTVAGKPKLNNPRDTSFPVCDKHNGYNSPQIRTTSFPVKYIPDNANPQAGACGGTYGGDAPGICIKPGFVHSGFANHCGAAVELRYNGITLKGKVVDVCGADAGSTMGCNDLFLTQAAFLKFGGDTAVGQLPGKVEWKFIELN
ncbi:hypothetical protein OC846_001892 [Tilletia horrida]|uniref:RlpA-like protein double-psi beta-barrel domain-containing protein n=1 Tax=Tilletia horrida TaxID=155126 RepID=A0AAN6JZG0_9BASI|nr:hypothetical protein OC845_001824 [Tilletia horrida]KAK0554942.1 hypothetical protein OC846_001892 [Tilletia horrida]KAK0568348.1 hypothetical protein OC861_002060 [Tilletia horrida]